MQKIARSASLLLLVGALCVGGCDKSDTSTKTPESKAKFLGRELTAEERAKVENAGSKYNHVPEKAKGQ